MSGGSAKRIAVALFGAAGALALFIIGSRAIGPGPVTFDASGPLESSLASTSLRVDSMSLEPAAANGGSARLDLAVTNVGGRDAIGVGYVLEDQGVVVDYSEAAVIHAGGRDARSLSWVPVGHGAHTVRVVVGDGRVHWVRSELHTGVFEDSTLPARRRRSAGAVALAGLAGALASTLAVALRPLVRVAPIIEVLPDPAADAAAMGAARSRPAR